MRNINSGTNVGARTSIVGKKILVKIPKKNVILGKKKDYIWIPIKFDLGEIGS